MSSWMEAASAEQEVCPSPKDCIIIENPVSNPFFFLNVVHAVQVER